MRLGTAVMGMRNAWNWQRHRVKPGIRGQPVAARARYAVAALRDIPSAVTPLAGQASRPPAEVRNFERSRASA